MSSSQTQPLWSAQFETKPPALHHHEHSRSRSTSAQLLIILPPLFNNRMRGGARVCVWACAPVGRRSSLKNGSHCVIEPRWDISLCPSSIRLTLLSLTFPDHVAECPQPNHKSQLPQWPCEITSINQRGSWEKAACHQSKWIMEHVTSS